MSELDEYAVKVLLALEPEYDYLVLVVPGMAKINDVAAAMAISDLKKAGLVAFDGRGRFKSVYLTPDGITRRREEEAKA